MRSFQANSNIVAHFQVVLLIGLTFFASIDANCGEDATATISLLEPIDVATAQLEEGLTQLLADKVSDSDELLQAKFASALELFRDGKFQEALNDANAVINSSDDNARAHTLLLGLGGAIEFQLENYASAKRLLLKSLKTGFESKVLSDEEKASLLHFLADTFSLMAEYEDALAALKEAEELHNSSDRSNDLINQATLKDLVTVYCELGDINKATETCDRMKQATDMSQKEQELLHGLYLSALGRIEFENWDYKNASIHLAQAVEIWQRFPENHIERIRALLFLATAEARILVSEKMHKERAAHGEKLINQAKELTEKSLGKRHPLYTMSLLNAAEIQMYLGNLESSMQLLEPATIYDVNSSSSIGIGYHSQLYAGYLDAQQKWDEAEEATMCACAIFKARGQMLRCADTMLILADVHMSQGKDTLALWESAAAEKEIEDKVGPYHPIRAQVSHSRAKNFFNKGKYESALTLFELNVAAYRRFYKEDNIWVAISLTHLGDSQVKMENYAVGSETLRSAISLMESNGWTQRPEYRIAHRALDAADQQLAKSKTASQKH